MEAGQRHRVGVASVGEGETPPAVVAVVAGPTLALEGATGLPDHPERLAAIVINKTDVTPAHLADVRWLDTVAPGVPRVHVSARTGEGVRELAKLLARIGRTSGGGKVRFVGPVNAGKSSLAKALADGPTEVLVSPVPGTTMGLLEVPLYDGNAQTDERRVVLVDGPGIEEGASSLLRQLSTRDVGAVTDRDRLLTRLHPRSFRMRPGSSLLIGGLARVDVESVSEEVGHVVLSAFVAPRVAVHACRTDRADDLRARHGGTPLLSPPSTRPGFDNLDPLERIGTLSLSPLHSPADLLLPSLGWLRVDSPASLGVWNTGTRLLTASAAFLAIRRPPLIPTVLGKFLRK